MGERARGRERRYDAEGWRVVGDGTQPARGLKREKRRRAGWRRTDRRRKERRVQLRVGRRSVCQSFVWTSRLTRLIVYPRHGIRVYASVLAASVTPESRRVARRVAADEPRYVTFALMPSREETAFSRRLG